MQEMLGPDGYKRLVARAHALMRADDPVALQAVLRIPDDTSKKNRDSELLAYMIETVAMQDAGCWSIAERAQVAGRCRGCDSRLVVAVRRRAQAA